MGSLRKLLKSTGRGLQMVLRALSVQKTGHSQLQQRVHPIFLAALRTAICPGSVIASLPTDMSRYHHYCHALAKQKNAQTVAPQFV